MGGSSSTRTLVAAICGSAIVFLDGTVVNVALPAIRRDLETGFAAQQWVIEAYLLALVSFLLIGGSFGDLFGRRRVFEIGILAFGLASIACAVAPSKEALIVARAAQGIAGALLVPGSLAILAAAFDGEQRGRAVGRWTAWTGIVTVAGPAIGGALIDLWSWRLIFWLNIPLVLLTVWLLRTGVAESRDPEAVRGVDYPGVALSAIGFGGPVFALIRQPLHGWGDPFVIGPLVVGVLALAGFVLRQRLAAAPMMPLELWRIRNFTAANLTTVTVYAGLIGSIFFISIFLQQTAGLSPLLAGLAPLPITILLFTLSGTFGALAGRIGPRLFMSIGPLIAGAGLLALTRVDAEVDYLADALPAFALFGLGLAITVAPLTATVLNSVPDRRSGIASGINNAVSRIAGLAAIVVLGVAVAADYKAGLRESLEGESLGTDARQAVERVSKRPLALIRFGHLPEGDRGVVAGAVVEASEQSFHLAMRIAAAAAVLGGLIAAAGIRNPPRNKLPA